MNPQHFQNFKLMIAVKKSSFRKSSRQQSCLKNKIKKLKQSFVVFGALSILSFNLFQIKTVH